MLDFKAWNETNFIFFDKGRSTGELRIWPKQSDLHFSVKETLTFEEAYKLATEQGKQFRPSEHFSSVKIFIELQEALGREIREYWVLAIKNWKTKERLVCPKIVDKELMNQYNLANAILGYKDAYDQLDDGTKNCFEASLKYFVERLVKQAF